MAACDKDTLMLLTADHGCDPTWPGTEHTREYIPVLAYTPGIPGTDLGERMSFADIGQTLADYFTLDAMAHGDSFLHKINSEIEMATPLCHASGVAFAETVLMPGDPLRAKHIAETFLTDAVCVNTVRNMFGYTGTYKGKPVSVLGSGMGIPSMSIYATELVKFYGVKNIIRIGSCGGLPLDVKVRDVVIGMGASTDSNVNRNRLAGMDFAAMASFELLEKAVAAAR